MNSNSIHISQRFYPITCKGLNVRRATVLKNIARVKCISQGDNLTNIQQGNDDIINKKVKQISNSTWLKVEQRKLQRQYDSQRYMIGVVAGSSLVAFLSISATYFRFFLQMDITAGFPYIQFLSTLLFVLGGVVAMEFYARWAHKHVWHDFQPGYALHKSHHSMRKGIFELNDIYAVANAVPALSLCLWGFITPGELGGLAFGAGMGISFYGIMYLFVHDGMVHNRFPVGMIAEWPYLKRVAAAHKIHHYDSFKGVPFGLFLGPLELKDVGGEEELTKVMEQMQEQRDREDAVLSK